jgi:hypothetical protein
MSLYKPQDSVFLSELQDSQCRVGFQSVPFEGKTTAMLTWPNPVIASWDRKVSAHCHRGDVPIIPFYDGEWLDKNLVRRDGLNCKPNRKDSLLKWLSTEGIKLSHEQTLILDGIPGIEASYHQWFEQHKDELATSRKGEFNKFVEWDLKKKYFEEVFDALKELKCDVLASVWETLDRDKEGNLNGKLKPLVTGVTGDKLGGNFTDWLAVVAVSKPTNEEQTQKLMTWAGITKDTVKEWCASTPPHYQSIHLFQTQDDSLRSCGCSSLKGAPKFIPATYEYFTKYRTKITTQ